MAKPIQVKVTRPDGSSEMFVSLFDASCTLDIPAARIVKHATEQTPSVEGLRFELIGGAPKPEVKNTRNIAVPRDLFDSFDDQAKMLGFAGARDYVLNLMQETLELAEKAIRR